MRNRCVELTYFNDYDRIASFIFFFKFRLFAYIDIDTYEIESSLVFHQDKDQALHSKQNTKKKEEEGTGHIKKKKEKEQSIEMNELHVDDYLMHSNNYNISQQANYSTNQSQFVELPNVYYDNSLSNDYNLTSSSTMIYDLQLPENSSNSKLI